MTPKNSVAMSLPKRLPVISMNLALWDFIRISFPVELYDNVISILQLRDSCNMGGHMRVPGVVMFVLITSLVAGLTPVLNAFWPAATVWWSAVLVVILGSIAAAAQAWKDTPKEPPQPPPGAQGISQLGNPPTKQRGFLGRMFVGQP